MLSEKMKLVNAGPPVNANGSGLDSAYMSLKNYRWATLMVQIGSSAGTGTITVQEARDVSGTGGKNMAFSYRAEETPGGDTPGPLTQAPAEGFVTGSGSNIYYVIEVSARELSPGYDCIRVRFSDPGAAVYVSMAALLGQPRYQGADLPSSLEN